MSPSESSDDEDAGRVVSAKWAPPASQDDVERHSPTAKSWWLIEPPDGAYRAAREFGSDEWDVFHDAGYSVRGFAPGAPGEVNAHAVRSPPPTLPLPSARRVPLRRPLSLPLRRAN